MLNNPFKNDPFAMVWTAFKNLYPDKDCDVWFDMRCRLKTEEGFGFTEFPNGENPQVVIFIDTHLPVMDMVEILGHELAHVAVGSCEGHSEAWEAAFEAIFQEYHCIGNEMFDPKEDSSESQIC